MGWEYPDTVYETCGKFYVFTLLAVLACAIAVPIPAAARREWALRNGGGPV